MRKLNTIFTSFVALLMFLIAWNSFNFNYFERGMLNNIENLKSNSIRSYELLLSTHIVDDLETFKEDLISFYEKYDYEGNIFHITIDNDNKLIRNSFVYTGEPKHYFEFFMKEENAFVDFKSNIEQKFYTNDPGKDDGFLIDYLDDKYYEYREGLGREIVDFYPLSHFRDSDIKTMQVFLYFYIPSEDYETLYSQLTEEILIPYGYLQEVDINDTPMLSDITAGRLVADRVLDLSGINWTDNLTEMPKPILIIAMLTLLLINFQYMISQSKELLIRKLHGNSNFEIFKKILLPTLFKNLWVFYGTNFLMWLIYVRSLRPLALMFANLIFKTTLIYTVLLLIVTVVLYFLLSIKSAVVMLKNNIDSSILTILATLSKVVAIIVVMIPVVVHIKHITRLENSKQNMVDDKSYMHSVLFGSYTQPVVMGTDTDALMKAHQWTKDFEKDLFNFINAEEISLVDTEHFYNDPLEKVLVNQYYVDQYIFYIDGVEVDLNDKSENYILVPQSLNSEYLGFVEGFIDAEIIYVDNTYKHIMNYAFLSDVKEDAIMYVVVDDYESLNSNFTYNLRKEITTQEERTTFNQAYTEFIESKGQYTIMNSTDLFDELNERISLVRQELYPLVGIALFVTMLFSYLTTSSYQTVFSKTLAVKYIHGRTVFERYRLLFFIYFTSLVGIVMGLLNYNFSQKEVYAYSEYSVDLPHTLIILTSVILIDSVLFLLLVRKFNKNSISMILKGEND